jgi:4-hydroxy-3-polyprenylbenzoate decarboxylase
MSRDAIALAMTGASGAQYGIRLLQCLLQANRPVSLMISRPAHMVIATETDLDLPARPEAIAETLAQRFAVAQQLLHVYSPEQWTAPLASGSNAPHAMVVCPCTSSTLSAIATGASNSLLERAADVVLKEQRKLILVHRETPLSVIHLENMLKLARLGVTILPANPGFYHRPETVESLVDFVVARVLDHLNIQHDLLPRWGEQDA